MRLAYKREELVFLYERLVKKAEQRFAKGEYSKSIKCIESAAYFQYLFNDRYSDNRLNSILKDISSKLYPLNTNFTTQKTANPQYVVVAVKSLHNFIHLLWINSLFVAI